MISFQLDLARIQESRAAITGEKESTQIKLERAELRLKSARDEVTELKTQLASWQKLEGKEQAQVEELQRRKVEAEANAKSREARVKELEKELKARQKELEGLESKVEELETNQNDLEEKARVATKKAKREMGQVQELTEQVEALKVRATRIFGLSM